MQISTQNRARVWRILRIVLGLLMLYGMGVGVRRSILEAQYAKLGRDFPFTLESALHYRRVKMLYDTGEMPQRDPMVGAPKGVEVRTTYEFGSERVQAALARLLSNRLTVADRLRWVEALWFCLGIPLMALWIRWTTGLWSAGAMAAGIYAVCIAAVMRSTGHELSKENFALPLLIAHYALEARVRSAPRFNLLWGALSGLFLGLAMASWDMIQFPVLLWALYHLVRVVRGMWTPTDRRLWACHASALVIAGLMSPYLRSHGFLISPLGLILAVTGFVGWVLPVCPDSLRARVKPLYAGAGLLLAGCLLLAVTLYGDSYHHFTDLLGAKLRHGNVKPLDPSVLTFEQRIMWVPALHSATWKLTGETFPALLFASLIALAGAFVTRRSSFPLCSFPVYMFLGSLLAFILFARFQVYLALFACVLTGVMASILLSRGGYRAYLAWGLAVLVWLVEISQAIGHPERWGRSNVYYPEMVELTRWLREHAAPDTVLAGFGISGGIAAYGKCAVVLHPKFEESEIRDRVRTYAEHLFKGTELSLRDWADGLGVDYLVYAKGEFSSVSPELQMRYMVDAMKPSTNAPAYRFEFHPLDTRWFQYRWSNRKYVVYKMLTRADEHAAMRHARNADVMLKEGRVDDAERSAVHALTLNPEEAVAQDVLRRIGLMRGGGTTERTRKKL